jgi:hypothetical protein
MSLACARLRSLAVVLALDGCPELVSVVSDEYFNERMNDVEQILLCVCAAASFIEPNFQNSNSCFSRGIRCDGVRPFHWQERTQMQSRKRAQAAGRYPLCVRALHLNRCPQQGSCLALHCHIKTLPRCETGRPGDPSRGPGRRRHGWSLGRGGPRAGRPTSASRYVSPEIPNLEIYHNTTAY